MWSFRQFIESDLNRDEAKARWVFLRDKAKILAQKGGLTRIEGEQYEKWTSEMNSIEFDLAQTPNIDNIKPAHERDSTLSPNVVLAARHDLLSNKTAYLAISSAAQGVFYNSITPIDQIVLGQNPELSSDDFYHLFDRTRSALRQEFGDKMTLYRATGKQISKPTVNYATTESYAKQFGPKVIKQEIPVSKILVVNVGLRGNYHEVIVLT